MDERGARVDGDGPDGMQQSGRIHESKRNVTAYVPRGAGTSR